MIVTSMFYTRAEQNKRTGYWCKHHALSIAHQLMDISSDEWVCHYLPRVCELWSATFQGGVLNSISRLCIYNLCLDT